MQHARTKATRGDLLSLVPILMAPVPPPLQYKLDVLRSQVSLTSLAVNHTENC